MAITQGTLGMDLITGQRRIMVVVRITAEALWRWPSGIGRTIAVADIGRATGITSGSQAIGCTGMAKGFGFGATTSCGDIDRATKARRLSSRQG
jgi:hypothetical protein